MNKAVVEYYKNAIYKDVNERVNIKGTTICDAIWEFAKLYHNHQMEKISTKEHGKETS